ncbi:Las1-domain-containing protein [Hysterangium stoloniferum]|nr:Las1-domain-containing protein [Hysterangium stoloniferum]
MRLPKRVPWSDVSEVEQLCSWVFSPEADGSTKMLAVNRLAAWRVSVPLPHALESTLSLLIPILQDEDSTSLCSTLLLRQSFSLALIRMVNGLVDPLQQGAYARSIASIAAQIGLPLWLVELRHASTHEELPSLELLREGTREAMSWLLRNFFLPTLSPNSGGETVQTMPSSLQPTLLQYKQLLKSTIRDASLKNSSKPELLRILQAFELWISEARVAASTITFDVQSSEDDDEKEKWSLEQFCEGLIGRGGLRTNPSQGLDVPIPQHIALWSPLLLHMYSRHPAFPSALLSRIFVHLFSISKTKSAHPGPTISDPVSTFDPSYDHALASWALWIINQWSDDPVAECDREDTIRELLLGLGRSDNKAARALLDSLTEYDYGLRDAVGLLSSSLQPPSRSSTWDDDMLQIMSERLISLRSQINNGGDNYNSFSDDIEMSDEFDQPEKPLIQKVEKIRGWQLLDERHAWKPCPIGMYKRI